MNNLTNDHAISSLVELMKEISHFDAYKVAVTVNPDDTVIDIIKGSIDFLQLHGSETNQRILEIKKRSNLKIIKAINCVKTVPKASQEIKASFFSGKNKLIIKPLKGNAIKNSNNSFIIS